MAVAGMCFAASSAVGLSGYVVWEHWVIGLVLCAALACVLAIVFGKPWLILCAIVAALPAAVVTVPERRLEYEPSPVPEYRCRDNTGAIGVALAEYQRKHGELPPAHIHDDSGRRMHSWRVLLLPYLGYDELYSRYRFDEPWDGPNNRLLWDEPVAVYQCPDDQTAVSTGATSYVAVVGESAVWSGDTPSRAPFRSWVRPGRLLVVELPNSGIRWSEPRDLSADADPSPDIPLARVLESQNHPTGNRTITAPIGGGEDIDERWTIEELHAWVRGDIVKQLSFQRKRFQGF